jgi:hypothetical protein
MGIYTEYLDKHMGLEDLHRERKKQLQRIAKARNRDVLAYASDSSTGGTEQFRSTANR